MHQTQQNEKQTFSFGDGKQRISLYDKIDKGAEIKTLIPAQSICDECFTFARFLFSRDELTPKENPQHSIVSIVTTKNTPNNPRSILICNGRSTQIEGSNESHSSTLSTSFEKLFLHISRNYFPILSTT